MKPTIESLQFFPPFNDDVKFEQFITSYFNELEGTYSYDRFGRLGQKQDGLDIYSTEKKTVIQCKLKTVGQKYDIDIRNELIEELKSDFKKFEKYNSKNNLSYNKFIFASTYLPDIHISTECGKLTNDKITVEYWSWRRIIDNIPKKILTENLGELHTAFEDYYNEKISDFQANIDQDIEFEVDRSKHIIDQIYDYLSFKNSELRNVPIHLLKNRYPFKKSDSYYPQYSSYTLSTDNTELFDFFDSLELVNGQVKVKGRTRINGVRQLSHKLDFIVNKLNNNLIFNIRLKETNNAIHIREETNDLCSCIKCSYNRLDFVTVFSDLDKGSQRIEDLLLRAHTNYMVGNYVESALHYDDVSKISHKKNYKIWFTIAQYNLSKLYVFVRNNLWDTDKALLDKLKNVDLEEVYEKAKTDDNNELLNWIIHTKFYHSSKEKISLTVSKIRDHYYSQKKGGSSSNRHIRELVNEYAKIDTFLNGNFIIYDSFSEYQELSNQFIEGVICSHSMKDSQTSKLEFFDDWLIKKLIFDGNAEELVKYIVRYELKQIKYQKTDIPGSTFSDLIENIFSQSSKIRDVYSENSEKQNRTFWTKYNQYFSNLLVIISFVDFSNKDIKSFSKKLLEYLRNEDFINTINLKYVKLFIRQKGHLFNKDVLYEFLLLECEKAKFHSNDIIQIVAKQIKRKYKSLELNTKRLQDLYSYAFEECKTCKTKHLPYFILDIYDTVNDVDIRDEISKKIKLRLDDKFDGYLYYISTIYGAIEWDDKLFFNYIDTIKQITERNSFDSIFGTSDNRYHQLNNLLDICFKYDYDLSKEVFDDFRIVDDYYRWLLDITNFDYKKFDPQWAYYYKTVHYIHHYKKHPILIQQLKDYLKNNVDHNLERLLFELSNKSE